MSLTLRVLSEHDVAKIIEALVESAERARADGDAVGDRLYLRLSAKIADALDEAVPGPGFAERVADARAMWREHATERVRRARLTR